MLGTHAEKASLGKLTRQVLENQNLSQSGCLPLLAKSPNRSMTCPLCGKAFPCVHSRRNTSALLDHQADYDAFTADEQVIPPPAASMRAVAGDTADPAWRREIVSRVQQHRARRRRPVDPNAM